ncbi:SDR family oxidoreductase [Roseimaritima sediminicola]|uniref:SDR family oxidoreductase n=1 Tax=Roseimaritima sediminicola TaxID=2662066 RepID=UPI0012984303|nr:SDR family oxidoreductase [Roseimaritima sediminicola]
MSTATEHRVTLVDPRTLYSQPPFKQQEQFAVPGKTTQMTPTPDHGEQTYKGSGKLSGLTALITGSDSGIGRAVALAYAREGADVAISYLSEDEDAKRTAELVREAGVKSVTLKGDLREQSTCESLIQQVVDQFGKLEILINNAAYQQTREQVDEFSTEVFDRVFKTNVYAPFWLSRAALAHLPPGGSIINTASIQSFDPSGYLLPYSASKGAVAGMTKAMSELAIKRGVRVNAVAPGPVWTPLIPSTMPEDKLEKFGGNTVFERPAQPAELAPLYVWLASPEASFVTGEIFGCTGGRTPL